MLINSISKPNTFVYSFFSVQLYLSMGLPILNIHICSLLICIYPNKDTYLNDIQWSLTYPDTSVPKLTVRITEYPDK